MYKCFNCGAVFDELVRYQEHMDYERQTYSIYYGCPNCRSDDVDQAVKCDLCGEYVTEDYVVLKDGTVACNDCFTLY